MNEQDRMCEAITQALREMDKYPNDSIEDIWNELFDTWNLHLVMKSNYIIDKD